MRLDVHAGAESALAAAEDDGGDGNHGCDGEGDPGGEHPARAVERGVERRRGGAGGSESGRNAGTGSGPDDPQDGELAVVLRDGRGGVTWRVWPIRAE